MHVRNSNTVNVQADLLLRLYHGVLKLYAHYDNVRLIYMCDLTS